MDHRRACELFLLFAMAVVWLACRALARYATKPWVLWAIGGYLWLLHVIFLAGLMYGPLFADGMPQLTLFTFPFSVSMADTAFVPGFGSLRGLAANYVRYVVVFGGLDSLLLGGFLALVLPARRKTSAESGEAVREPPPRQPSR